jgi:Uma2 family endonuclease
MAAITQVRVSVSEYLRSNLHPDCDYVDGEVEERNMGEIEHSRAQMAIARWLDQHREEWGIVVLPEVRMRISEIRYRVADIAVVSSSNRERGVLHSPPLLVIEILSPEDRVSRYEERIADYQQMGVGAIWIIDPETRRGYDCSTGSWVATTTFSVPGSPIALDIAVLFDEVD